MPDAEFSANADTVFAPWRQGHVLTGPLPSLNQAGGMANESLACSRETRPRLVAHEE
jgi:hypothetical protein